MSRIALVVSDVDGTLVTKDKILTGDARSAVRSLRAAGIGFTIVSSRPTIGMGFLIAPLDITLPIGAFNGSSIVDAQLKPIEQHLIAPAVAQRSLDVLNEFGVDIWLFSNERWYTRNPDGEYVPHEKRAIKADPTIVEDFTPHLSEACKIVGASSDMQNDLPMFARSGMSFAMGNATDDVKKRATHVTDTNERDGFARAMETVLKLG
jgi:hydroxymethylpyrimidine pyrophosphatase-like HAD family hydrolase